MATEKKPDLASNSKQIRASVLHGAKDLRIVRTLKLILHQNSIVDDIRKTAPYSLQAQQISKSLSAQQASAAQTCTTTDTTEMATSSSRSPCRLVTNLLV